MKVWWLAGLGRLALEKSSVEGLAREDWFTLTRWTTNDFLLVVEGTIIAHGHEYAVRLVYPDQYPEVPAWVEPQDGSVRWSGHQYGAGGCLCLELRPDNWFTRATGADVLTSAYNLLRLENPLGNPEERGTAPSAEHIGQLQSYPSSVSVLIGSGCRDRILAKTSADPAALSWPLQDKVWPVLIADQADRESRQPPESAGGLPIRLIITTAEVPTEPGATREEFLAQWATPEEAEMLTVDQCALVIFAGATTMDVFHIIGEGHPFRCKVITLPDDSGVRSARNNDLPKQAVTVVGAGSVGSKIAESLVRSGLRNLLIVDGDILIPGNLERHTLDWRDIGYLKASVLKRRLLHISPSANIRIIAQNLNWQRSASRHADQIAKVASGSVIVDATGDPATGLFLGAIASANNRSFVSVEVFEGGIGALLASCVPGRDPPFAVAHGAFLAWCAEQNEPVPQSSRRRYEAVAEDGTPLVADDAAVTAASGHAARVVLDLLAGDVPPAEMAWMLIGFRKGWIFPNGHGDVIRLKVAGDEQAPSGTSDPETEEFAVRLWREATGAADNREGPDGETT